jgi:hypothetical protein
MFPLFQIDLTGPSLSGIANLVTRVVGVWSKIKSKVKTEKTSKG